MVAAPRTMPAVLVMSHRVVVNHMMEVLKERAERSDKRVIFIETSHACPGVMEVKRAKKYIEAGAVDRGAVDRGTRCSGLMIGSGNRTSGA
jgi:hypothetical protein